MPKRSRGTGARPIQIGEQVRQCLSQMLIEGSIKDHRIKEAGMVTVTEVRMTPDLRLGRVLVSVFPDDPEVVTAVFAGLNSATGEIKREIGRRLRLRYTPDLRFLVDDSMAYGAHIETVLKEIQAEQPAEDAEAAPLADEERPEEA